MRHGQSAPYLKSTTSLTPDNFKVFLIQPEMVKLDTAELGYMWDKVFKKGPSENCGRQPLKI